LKRTFFLLFAFALLVRVQHGGGALRWEERDIIPALRDISVSAESFHLPIKAGDHTPLSVILAWPFHSLSPGSAWLLRIPSLVLGALIPCIVAVALAGAGFRRAGIFAGILLATNNFMIAWSAYFMQEMSYLLFATLGLVAFGEALVVRSTTKAVVAGLFFALAFWSHEFAVGIIPIVGTYLVLADNSTRRWLFTSGPWIGFGAWILLVSPYFIWNLLMRPQFLEHGGMSIAQQHILGTILARRGFNARFFEFFVAGGARDLLTRWPSYELNNVDPFVGAFLLLSSAVCLAPRMRKPHLVKLSFFLFWAIILFFCFFDLSFRIYRFSLALLPGSVLGGMLLSRLWDSKRRLLRTVVICVLSYVVLIGVLAQPYAKGAAHKGFRWWRVGPLFAEAPLLRALRTAQTERPATLVVLPAPFWDHVPCHAEYVTGVRCVGGSRETIYSSTYWNRPYTKDEARHLRVVVSCQEDVNNWWNWLNDQGYDGSMSRREVEFHGIVQDTTVVCPLYFMELEHTDPPPVSRILARIYEDL
jgi:4-amino-4-deoxy-L-arabinose transferase-like glycosyltransferase